MNNTHAHQLAVHKATLGLDDASPTGWTDDYNHMRVKFGYNHGGNEERGSSRCPKCGTFHAGRCSQRDIEEFKKSRR